MDRYDAKRVQAVEASPKLDGVYARATRDGIFTKSGQKLQGAHIEARLRRYFRKRPDGALEGELWRKGAGIEEIAGEARSGKTEKLRLHVYPGQEGRPWGIGAVRRVPAWKVKDDAGVQAAMARALRKGHEGVVVRGADGVKTKLKPQEDAEWKVESLKAGKKKTVLVMKTAEGRPFKVQAGGGAAAAKEGDRVQVRYSGLTRRGVPKAAVAVRVRETEDFETEDRRKEMKNLKRQDAKSAKLKSFLEKELTGRDAEKLREDRKALLKGAILTAAGVGAGYLLLRGEKKVPGASAGPAPMPKWKVERPGLPAPRPVAPPLRERVTRWGGRNEKETYTKPVIALRGKAEAKAKGPGMKAAARANNERKGGVKRLVRAAELKRERAWGALKPPSAKRLARLNPAVRAEYARLDAAARQAKPLPKPAANQQVTAREVFGKAEQGARKVNRQILQGYREQKNFWERQKTMRQKTEEKNFAVQDPKAKRDGLSKARDAALLAGGLGVLGASGYGALKVRGLYKVAKKAIPRQARKLRKTAEGALKAAKEELPAIRKATDVTQQKIQETAKRVQESADNVVNSTAVYSDAGKFYKGLKGGLGNILHPRRTLREVKDAFRSGYRSGHYGAPDSFVPQARAKWELAEKTQDCKTQDAREEKRFETPAGRLLRGFEEKPMTQEEMERLYGKKWASGQRSAVSGKEKKKRGWIFETPASRVIDFGNEEQWREKDTRRYGNPLKAAAGMEKGYFKYKPGTKEPDVKDIPLAHAQVLKGAYNKAHAIQKHATRAGSLGSDVVAVATGKPRERDQAGREKKREWEKPWFKTAARNVAITGAMLYGAKRLRDNPRERAWVKKQVNRGVKKVNSYVPDLVKEWEEGTSNIELQTSNIEGKKFETPAGRLIGFGVADKLLRPLRKGGLGKLLGPDGAQKAATADRVALVGRLKAAAARGDTKAAAMVPRAKRHAAMKQAKLGAAVRGQKDALRGLKKGAKIAAGGALVGGTAMKLHADQPEERKLYQGARFRNALVGAAAGAMMGGGLHAGKSGYSGARIGAALGGLIGAAGNPKRKQVIEELPVASFEAKTEDFETEDRRQEKRFSTPASRLIGFDDVAADAGWDIRDPRGKSARVFAPGSRQRVRREKEWHEKKENRDKLALALATATGIAGLAGGVKLGKTLALRKKMPVTAAAPTAGYGYAPTMGPRSTYRRETFRKGTR